MSENTLERWGHSYPLADSIPQLPLWRFGKLAKKGSKASDMDAYAAMYDLLEACFTPEGWAEFESTPEANAADEDELTEVLGHAMAAVMNRPTSRPSVSSGGSQTTSVKSGDDSSLPVIDRLVAKGRPDLALIVTQAQEQRSA